MSVWQLYNEYWIIKCSGNVTRKGLLLKLARSSYFIPVDSRPLLSKNQLVCWFGPTPRRLLGTTYRQIWSPTVSRVSANCHRIVTDSWPRSCRNTFDWLLLDCRLANRRSTGFLEGSCCPSLPKFVNHYTRWLLITSAWYLCYLFQVLDVERMVAKNTMPQAQDQGGGTNLENHPVIRTLYDHMEVQQT